jgi:hypothetical protein
MGFLADRWAEPTTSHRNGGCPAPGPKGFVDDGAVGRRTGGWLYSRGTAGGNPDPANHARRFHNMRENRVPGVGRAGALTVGACAAFAAVHAFAAAPVPGGPPAAGGGDAASAVDPGIPTEIVVRVRARGAMFVTTDMGVKVILSDADTGEVLAQGVTTGTVGGAQDMRAAFRATLPLTGPRRLRVSATGPLSYPHATTEVTSTQWVVPGGHVRGEGWVLEMPGFIVDLEAAPARVLVGDGPAAAPLRARVVMMCGCPTEPGGRWDADGYEIRAVLHRGATRIGEYPLTYAGEPSTYVGDVPLVRTGHYDLLVYAYDPETGNTGLARHTIDVVDED